MDARELLACIDTGLLEVQSNDLIVGWEQDVHRELLGNWRDREATRPQVHYEIDSIEGPAALGSLEEPRFVRKEPAKPPQWLLGLSSTFVDHAERIDRKLRGRVLEAITALSNMQLEVRGDTLKPLSGEFKGCWRYRIGDYRLIFLPDKEQGTLTLMAFLPRRDAYD